MAEVDRLYVSPAILHPHQPLRPSGTVEEPERPPVGSHEEAHLFRRYRVEGEPGPLLPALRESGERLHLSELVVRAKVAFEDRSKR